MYARAVDDAAERLGALRQEECGALGLAALALGLAVAVTQVHPQLALPLFLGGLGVGALGLRAVVLRWDLLERLAGERDALVIPEVRAYASREATIERRRTFAAMLRRNLSEPGRAGDQASPLLNPAAPVSDLRSRIRQIRSGFAPGLAGARD